MNIDLTLLTRKQVSDENVLTALRTYGTRTIVTDFCTLLGAYSAKDIFDESKKYCHYWLKDFGSKNGAWAIDDNGFEDECYVDTDSNVIRPALQYSAIEPFASNETVDESGVVTFEYGEYPQTAVNKKYSNKLNRLYNRGKLKPTGKIYTIGIEYEGKRNKISHPKTIEEFEYEGKKYVRVIGKAFCDYGFLSDGRQVDSGKEYWVAVEPIKWILDEESDLAISEKAILSGIPFQKWNKSNNDFNKTDIKVFMDTYLSKDIIPSLSLYSNAPAESEYTDNNFSDDGVEKPRRSLFGLFTRKKKRKINPDLARVQLAEIDKLSYELLKVPEGKKKEEFKERYQWIIDYYNNNYNIIADDKADLEDLQFREILNELTLEIDTYIEKSNENTQKRI